MKKLKVGVCGASGYAGLELLNILKKHPDVEVSYITSESHENVKVRDFEPSLIDYHDYAYLSMKDDSIYNNIDAVFLALPHEASAISAPKYLKNGVKVIDLSAAFRIKDIKTFEKTYKFTHPSPELIPEAVYGLTEIYRESIRNARLIANPGCYPTSALIPLIPLLKKKIIKPENIIIDSKSGFTGRGRKADIPSVFSELNENFYAYGIGTHRHKPEILQELNFAWGNNVAAAFTPHIMPIDRGILSTIYIHSDKNIIENVLETLIKFYQNEQFIKVFKNTLPQMKWVAHTNYNYIGAAYDSDSRNLIIVSVIDNLVKGAAGSAVQNFNVMSGIEETEGLI